MRLRLTDGTREVDLRTPGNTPLPELEATALRLYRALHTDPPEQPTTGGIGFGQALDGWSLDSSSTERAEPYDDGRDQYEDDET